MTLGQPAARYGANSGGVMPRKMRDAQERPSRGRFLARRRSRAMDTGSMKTIKWWAS